MSDFSTILELIRAGQPVILTQEDKSTTTLLAAADCVTPEQLHALPGSNDAKVSLALSPDWYGKLSPLGDDCSDYYKEILPQVALVCAHPKGSIVHSGEVEAAVDLMQIADLNPAALLMPLSDATALDATVPMLSVSSIRNHRIRTEVLVEERIKVTIPLREYGLFEMVLFKNELDEEEHFALMKAPVDSHNVPFVRIHSECITGDVFGSCKCDCGQQLDAALRQIAKEGGVLLYLRQEGRGIGLENKLKAYALQAKGMDTVEANVALGLPADKRDYAVAFQMLKHLGLPAIRLLTNNPKKVNAMTNYGVKVVERIPIAFSTAENKRYLQTKRDKLGHFLEVE